MLYQISHRTLYTYDSPVTVAHYIARLEPRPLPTQSCPWHEINIRPRPACRAEGRSDAFGNTGVYFEVEGTHAELEVVARSYVRLKPRPLPEPAATPPWESIRGACRGDQWNADTAAGEFAWPSPLIPLAEEFAAYAAPSFRPGRPVLEAVCDLNRRIFTDFSFDPKATSVSTPLKEVLAKRRGVCQDFAHFMTGCLRVLGLPARYMSGYIRTTPPPGQARLVGADASHAWVSVYCGGARWVDLDPTNNVVVGDGHVTLAWGRDFSDVTPMRGVILEAANRNLRSG